MLQTYYELLIPTIPDAQVQLRHFSTTNFPIAQFLSKVLLAQNKTASTTGSHIRDQGVKGSSVDAARLSLS
jgi:hypothetical protein